MASNTAGLLRWQGRVAVVTGASSGIGAAVCRSLVKLGISVYGVARAHHKIQAMAKELSGEKGSLTAIQCDVTKDDEVRAVFKQVLETSGALHLCVNNAGMSYNTSLLDGCPAEWREAMAVNVVAVCHFSKLAVQSMRDTGVDDGHIINIGSVLAQFGPQPPSLHFYSATKAAVRALTEGLRQELRAAKSHIRISSVSPGRTSSEFAQRMTGSEVVAAMGSSDIQPLQPEDVAASLLHILTAPPHVEINDVLIRPTEQII